LQRHRTEKNCFKKFADTLKKIKNADTQADRKETSKMTMTRNLNNDNGLQDWKTEHQAATGGIFYCRDSVSFSVSASNKLSCDLTDLCFEIGNKTYRQSVVSYKKKKLKYKISFLDKNGIFVL
jgi:hypothetical protein